MTLPAIRPGYYRWCQGVPPIRQEHYHWWVEADGTIRVNNGEDGWQPSLYREDEFALRVADGRLVFDYPLEMEMGPGL